MGINRVWRTDTSEFLNVGSIANDVLVNAITTSLKSGILCGLQAHHKGGIAPTDYDIAVWVTEHTTWAPDDEFDVDCILFKADVDPTVDYKWDGELEFQNMESPDAAKSYQLWVGIRITGATITDDYDVVLTIKRCDL